MNADEVSVGMKVRYPRTGTTGKVERLEKIESNTFAELDSTHLLYRVDQLIPIGTIEGKKIRKEEDIKKVIEGERELAFALREELAKSDEMCDGGG